MLSSVNLNDKTYAELLSEAIARIPLYSREWTNFNVSDPGITILQNLTAFQLLQQEAINQVPDEVRRKLLQLAGYTAKENHPATVLVQAPAEGGPILRAGHQLWSGTIPFETESEIVLQPWGLKAVYVCSKEHKRDVTRLLDRGTEMVTYPFGRVPEEENSFVCVLSGIPEMGEPVRLWLQVAQEELRTAFQDEEEIPTFSKVRWQYYTNLGWQDARFEDDTIGLLRSGAVTLWFEGDSPAIVDEFPVQGCALRCILDRADYDRTPRLQYIAAHLFPMVQQETRITCVVCEGGLEVELQGRLPQLGNLLVYGRETEHGPYYFYREAPVPGVQGRFYSRKDTPWGVTLRFEYGAVPYSAADAVRVVCLDDEMIHHYMLDPVYGYDDQVIHLDLVRNVLPERFLLTVGDTLPDGTVEYWFVAPGERGPDGFSYHLRSRDAQLVIDDPGCGGYELFLACCTVTQGNRGNLRSGAVLEQRGGYDGTEVEARYDCPAPGIGGVSYESAEEVRQRFSAGMRKTTVAVRAEDYELLVRQAPGLCIHKVKAVADREKNLVRIIVKPHLEEPFPKLSEDYILQIASYLEPRRMLTTRFEICQPRYAPVAVNASLCIRGTVEYAREETQRILRETLDHINGKENFGGVVRFNDLYQKLSGLPFMVAVDSLTLIPENQNGTLEGSDIRLGDDCLCYPGRIDLIFREHGR